MKRLLFTFLLVATRAHAQVVEMTMTPAASAEITSFYNAPATSRLPGESRVAAGNEVAGNVAVLEGTFTLGGRIRGDLLVINGDLVVESGATVDGTVTVAGGNVNGIEQLRANQIIIYRERLKYELRDGVLMAVREVPSDEISAGREFAFGRTDLLIAARGGYNRSEGLPVHIGPRLTLGKRNPTLLQGTFIFRTAAGFDFDEDDYGYILSVEQFLGGRYAARLGFRYASEVLPIETWGLSDREASLAAFLLHQDYRDHYGRDGWTLYLTRGRSGLPFDWRIEFGTHEFENAVRRDPISVLHNDDNWRAEVLIPNVRLRTLGAHARYDTRNENRDPSSGWLARAELDFGISLRSGTADNFEDDYQYALIDLRRYARLSPSARIAIRAVAAGSIKGDALPSFRQQSLGGEGSLPGYELYDFDCDGHDQPALDHLPYYGCDRLLLLQTEYQSNFRWLSRLGRDVGRDFGLLDNIKWVLFFNTGRTWNDEATRGVRSNGVDDFVADAGFGLRFGTIGAYWAAPLSARRNGINFFVRIGPRL